MINFTDMSKTYTIKLSNGRELNDVHLNGNNFFTIYKIDKEMFAGGLRLVTVSDGTREETYENMQLLQITYYDDSYGLEPGWYFVLEEISPEKLKYAKIQADIEYLSMMTDVEIQ